MKEISEMGGGKGIKLFEESVLAEYDERELLNEWLESKYSNTELLWRCTTDGFSASSFHAKCDGKGPTVVIIKSTQGKRFGGFTKTGWQMDNEYRTDHSNWVFSLTNKTKHKHYRNYDRSMYCGSSYLVVFGGCDCDFRIVNNCNTDGSSYTNLGFAYECPEGMSYDSDESKSYLAGSSTFFVEELELFLLTE